MKNLIEFKLENGESAFMQIEESEEQARQRVSRRGSDESQTQQAEHTFNEAIRCIAPIGNALLDSLKNINTPSEIKLEFGLTFTGKAGVVFTSVESEASFKVSLTWKN